MSREGGGIAPRMRTALLFQKKKPCSPRGIVINLWRMGSDSDFDDCDDSSASNYEGELIIWDRQIAEQRLGVRS
jgi:hypothetical protein